MDSRKPIDGTTHVRLPQSKPAPPTLYSAPRRFDLATLLAVTVAYALLFTALRVLRSEPVVFGVVGGFFTAVAIGQALLFQGNAPRKASILVGAIYWTALEGFLVGWNACFAISFFVWGGVSGYVGGTLVAGIFLVADALRRAMSRPPGGE